MDAMIRKNWKHLSVKHQNRAIWKDRAHQYFDLIWQHRHYAERNDVYISFQMFLGISASDSHMKNMSNNMCKKVIKWSIDILNGGMMIENRLGVSVYAFVEYPDYLELS